MKVKHIGLLAVTAMVVAAMIPVGAMASTGYYSGTDESTLSSSDTASWNNKISQSISVSVGSNFDWDNYMHNNKGISVQGRIIVTDTSGSGNIDNMYHTIAANYYYHGHDATSTVTAVSGGARLGVVHQYQYGSQPYPNTGTWDGQSYTT